MLRSEIHGFLRFVWIGLWEATIRLGRRLVPEMYDGRPRAELKDIDIRVTAHTIYECRQKSDEGGAVKPRACASLLRKGWKSSSADRVSILHNVVSTWMEISLCSSDPLVVSSFRCCTVHQEDQTRDQQKIMPFPQTTLPRARHGQTPKLGEFERNLSWPPSASLYPPSSALNTIGRLQHMYVGDGELVRLATCRSRLGAGVSVWLSH
jgi:hypothetical protein